MIAFVMYAAGLREPYRGFGFTAILSGVIGTILLYRSSPDVEPSRREAIIGVLVLWLLIPLIGAIPFWIDGGMSYLNALFESMSGFTTTGATALVDFGNFPLSMFMWRSLMQWLGRIGIIVLFVAVLPRLALAGRQMFMTETPGPTEELLAPKLRTTALAIAAVYSLLTVLAIGSYWLAGMPLFDAVANGLTTPASGGFSPNGLSIAGYGLPVVEWLAVLFMTLAGASFVLQYRALQGNPAVLFRDAEFRAYLFIILIGSILLTFTLQHTYLLHDAVRHAAFQVLAIVTGTGYASADFALWPDSAQAILALLMFSGGSAGSAAGGIKVIRWLIIIEQARSEVQRSLHPRSVQVVRVGNKILESGVIYAVAAFVILFISLVAVITVALAVLGADLTTAFTASIASVGNIGPGLGAVGPMLSYADLHPVSRALLIFGMYAGRLEVVTVFVVFQRAFWRLPRRRWLF